MTKRRDYPDGQVVPGTIYQVIKIVGSGGMGTVYEVEDTTIGKLYVLKTLHPELQDRRDLARRMQSEARALARMRHPNIVEVVTAGATTDELRLPYYVMERLTGQNLRGVLDRRTCLDVPHACHIAVDLLDALDHAHDKGVIHRDVKPENVFLHHTLTGVTVTKLLDFGVMTLLDDGARAARRDTAGAFVGTFRYAAPEQLRGEKPSTQMDVYAAALVLFEMVAGRGPFDDEPSDKQVAEARLSKVSPSLSKRLEAAHRPRARRPPPGRPASRSGRPPARRVLVRRAAPQPEAALPAHRAARAVRLHRRRARLRRVGGRGLCAGAPGRDRSSPERRVARGVLRAACVLPCAVAAARRGDDRPDVLVADARLVATRDCARERRRDHGARHGASHRGRHDATERAVGALAVDARAEQRWSAAAACRRRRARRSPGAHAQPPRRHAARAAPRPPSR